MAGSRIHKQSSERARKRGKGDIYDVIDDLIAPSFAIWVQARSDRACITTSDLREAMKERGGKDNQQEQQDTGIDH